MQIDMYKGPNHPPVAVMAEKFNSEWAGQSHHDFCIDVVDGKGHLDLLSQSKLPERYIIYYVPTGYVTVRFEYDDRHKPIINITIDPKTSGDVCVGESI